MKCNYCGMSLPPDHSGPKYCSEEHRTKKNQATNQWAHNNPEKKLANSRHQHAVNRERDTQNTRKWIKANPARAAELRRVAHLKQRHRDLCTKLAIGLRRRLYMAIKSDQKAGSAVVDLGCSITEFKCWIEWQFQQGMSWDNWGQWHLDHIRPLASFDLTDRGQFMQACHFTNYQPLWAADNIAKADQMMNVPIGVVAHIEIK